MTHSSVCSPAVPQLFGKEPRPHIHCCSNICSAREGEPVPVRILACSGPLFLQLCESLTYYRFQSAPPCVPQVSLCLLFLNQRPIIHLVTVQSFTGCCSAGWAVFIVHNDSHAVFPQGRMSIFYPTKPRATPCGQFSHGSPSLCLLLF